MIVVIWFNDIDGKIKPFIFAPGNVYAAIWKPGKKLRRANRNAIFKTAEIKPKVSILMGRNTSENIGFIASVMNHRPAIVRGKFLGLSPTVTVEMKFIVVKKDAIVIKRDFI